MSGQVEGTVSAVRKDRKGFQIDGDIWYSSFNALPMDIGNGVKVKFGFVQKGQWNNIKGGVDVLDAGSGVGAANSESRSTNPTKSGFMPKEFPVPQLHPDRSIIRQNALAHATKVVLARGSDGMSMTIEQIIDVARMFEAYSTGDVEREEADKQMKGAGDAN